MFHDDWTGKRVVLQLRLLLFGSKIEMVRPAECFTIQEMLIMLKSFYVRTWELF